jgi:hypothetical protein
VVDSAGLLKLKPKEAESAKTPCFLGFSAISAMQQNTCTNTRKAVYAGVTTPSVRRAAVATYTIVYKRPMARPGRCPRPTCKSHMAVVPGAIVRRSRATRCLALWHRPGPRPGLARGDSVHNRPGRPIPGQTAKVAAVESSVLRCRGVPRLLIPTDSAWSALLVKCAL